MSTPSSFQTGKQSLPIVFQIVVELILELPAPDTIATSTVTQRVSGLDHELGDDAVEDDTLKVAALRMPDEVLDCFRCLLREQSYVNIAECGVDSCGGSEWCSKHLRVSRRCSDCLLVSRRALIEDISVARLISEMKSQLRSTCTL